MVSAGEINGANLVCDVKLSTVVPASITGDDKNQDLGGMDLALKLHYITTVHFFGGDAVEGLSIHDFKKPMFEWLQLYYPICGRLRRHDGGRGRPYVKCNDSGVRIVEATCTITVAEWLATVDGGDHHRLLVYHQPILAHDFGFTPLVFLQLTRFKCGGLSVGMRWAHILGDAFSATECINMWGKMMAANQTPPTQLVKTLPPTIIPYSLNQNTWSCRSVKMLESLGDNWLTPNNFKMKMHTFYFTEKPLNNLLSREEKNKYRLKTFDVIAAIIWKSMSKVRETNIVTICKKREFDHEKELLGNRHQVIGTVEVKKITDVDPIEISKLIAETFIDETSLIKKQMEEGNGNIDCMVYGSNLTFVDLKDVNLYRLQLKGQPPIFANLSIGEVGEKGVVVVVPDSREGGRVVNVVMHEDQLEHLKNELRVEWNII